MDKHKQKLIIDSLAYISILDKLDFKELNLIAGYVDLIQAVPGEIIFKEGDKGDFVKGISRFLSLNMRQTSSKLADQLHTY